MNEKSEKLTVCIPSYNRGVKALSLVEQILADEEFDDSLHLLVSDNASELETSSYQRIRDLAEDNLNLTYIRQEKNLLAHGNYLACFKEANSQYIMMLSDEDFPLLQAVHEAVPAIYGDSTIGIIRGAIGSMPNAPKLNASTEQDAVLKAGEEALLGFTLTNNYFSGTIYNRSLLEKYKLLERLESNLQTHASYPLLYLEILVCALCDVKTMSAQICIEGEPQHEGQDQPAPTTYYPGAYSFGGRVDQFFLLRDAFREAIDLIDGEFDTPLFLITYLRLCEKYCYLIVHVNAPTYANHGIHPEFLHRSLLSIFEAGLTTYPEIKDIYPSVQAEIIKIHDKYKGFWN